MRRQVAGWSQRLQVKNSRRMPVSALKPPWRQMWPAWMHEAKQDRGEKLWPNFSYTQRVSISLRLVEGSSDWTCGTWSTFGSYIRNNYYNNHPQQQHHLDNQLMMGICMQYQRCCYLADVPYNIMRNFNNNNNRLEDLQSLKTIAKSAYSITDRNQSKHYLSKIQTIRKTSSRPLHEQTTLIASNCALPSPPTLKQQYNHFVRELFKRLDFDHGGFVSSSKIAHDKDMGEAVFYFFGGVFQKIRQVGAVTQKLFLSLCDELFLQARAADIQEVLAAESAPMDKQQLQAKGKQGKRGKHSHSSNTLKLTKSMAKMDSTGRQDHTPLHQSKLANYTLSKKDSLKLHLQSLDREKYSYSQPKQKQAGKQCQQTKRRWNQSNFDSLRVRQLSERLDRQLLQNQTRTSLNKYLR